MMVGRPTALDPTARDPNSAGRKASQPGKQWKPVGAGARRGLVPVLCLGLVSVAWNAAAVSAYAQTSGSSTGSIELGAPSSTGAPQTGGDVETLFWTSILNSEEPDLYRQYLVRWPNGKYAPIAKWKIEELESGAPGAVATPATPNPAPQQPLGRTGTTSQGSSSVGASDQPPGTAPPASSPSTFIPPASSVPSVSAPLNPAPVVRPPASEPASPSSRALGADGSNNPNAMTAVGRSSLMIAARDNDVARLRTLLDAGASVDQRAPDGHTALTLAAQEGHVDSARILILAGADPMQDGPTGPAWTSLSRIPAGRALLSQLSQSKPEIGEAILSPNRGDWRTAQARLNALGYGAGPVDGQPGSRTRRALASFQSAQGLLASGYLTQESMDRLRAAAPSVRPPPVQSSPSQGGAMQTVLVVCRRVEAVLGGDGADIPNPLKVTLDSPMEVESVQVDAHDDVGFFTNAVLNVYLDGDFVARRDVKSAGSLLTYTVGRSGRTLELYSREEDGLSGDEETYIRTIKVYAKRPSGTPEAACR